MGAERRASIIQFKFKNNLKCKDDFLGFSFQPIRFRLRSGGSFLQFDCKMSRKSKVRITGELRELAFHNKTQRGIQDLAKLLNPKIRGWIQYYGR